MKNRENHRKSKYRIILISILLSISIVLEIIFQLVLQTRAVFSHFFYIPIIFSSIWWKKKGIIIAIILASSLIIFPIFTGSNILSFENLDIFLRATLMIIIGCVVSFLSENIAKKESQLKNRVKQLNCLYGIIKYLENPVISVEEILMETLDTIQKAWKDPTLTCTKITFDGKEYISRNFRNLPQKITTRVKIKEKELCLNVHYLQEKGNLKEDKKLLEKIAEQLKAVFEFKLI